ncbi:hypothetical protein KOI35_09080 [Actinoplanes bogorensis]|uniref:WD40 repeat domain-containing protein n=1 Tax=Paractinoplanes bogorensis TaxID=1610840 RepID=A0ABS5YJL3_9ACTN|nr:hypothetical protein [Actinoplanes bogorensis]
MRTGLSLLTALAAGAVLLFVPPSAQPDTGPLVAGLVWPDAQRGSFTADLPDGSTFTPALFLDARTAIGTAQSRDGSGLRLVLRKTEGAVRVLRPAPPGDDASFPAVTASGDDVVWAEGHGDGRPQLWKVNLRDGRPPRLITGDTGDARFYQSEYDLLVAGGRVHWVAAGDDQSTELRSVALSGGPVRTSTQPGTWQQSVWPWLVDGVASTAGATVLRNPSTGRDMAVAANQRAVTNCTPSWCRVVSLDDDGMPRIEMMRPDGAARLMVAEGVVQTAVADVAVLDRFEVYAQGGGNADLTGNFQLFAYDITGRRAVQISPDAANVGYRAGVLWWSTGNRELFLWHSLDLRTV